MAQTLAWFISRIAERLVAENPPLPTYAPLGPVVFASHEAAAKYDTMCHPALISMPSSSSNNRSHSFIPYQAPKLFSMYYMPWAYESDIPGKPPGWISHNSQIIPRQSRLAFYIALIEGHVSITYLETYRNAGIMEIWLSMVGYADSLEMRSSSGDVIGCCDTSKVALYPTIHRGLSTYSAYIDTYRNASRVSEIVTRTIQFAQQGVFLVNIRHFPVGSEEHEARQGDKVKLLGVHSC